MQFLGLLVLFGVVALGFWNRDLQEVRVFDLHAIAMVTLGSIGAIMVGSSTKDFLKTFSMLSEIFPFLKRMSRESADLDSERLQYLKLWKEGERTRALALAEGSSHEALKVMNRLVVKRASLEELDREFLELIHEVELTLEPAARNWDMIARLAPSFGMVGTITGMIQLFKSFGTDNANIGAAMSLAMVATLYGVFLGAGIGGPVSRRLESLIDAHLATLDRCKATTLELIRGS